MAKRDGGSAGVKPTQLLLAVALIVFVQISLFVVSIRYMTATHESGSDTSGGGGGGHLGPASAGGGRKRNGVSPSSSMSVLASHLEDSKRRSSSSTSSTLRGGNEKLSLHNANQPGGTVDENDDAPVVGTFNNFNVRYRTDPIHSTAQCVGSNFQSGDIKTRSWIYRSCKFRHFCFDTDKQDFVLFQSKEEQELNQLADDPMFEASTSMNTSVAIGGVNTKWTWKDGVPRLEWFPEVRLGELTDGYYELDPDVVWAPFHSLAAFNPGHLVWDDFLPVYTLLRMFQLLEGHTVMMMRYILKGGRGMWASCDMNQQHKSDCKFMLHKFLPLMGQSKDNFTTTEEFRFELKDQSQRPRSKLVCARHGVAGLGMLTDHGLKLHGWHKKDYEEMHNHGRGPMLWDFRNHMLSHIGISTKRLKNEAPFLIVFSIGSSEVTMRQTSFLGQRKVLKEAFGDRVEIKAVQMKQMSLYDQVKLISETAIFVTVCGGGAVTATFLPLGSAVLMYYQAEGGHFNNRPTGLPARLDWDLINNAAYMRPHWLPMDTMDTTRDQEVLVKLVEHELDIISHEDY